jgi:hypothetical protein
MHLSIDDSEEWAMFSSVPHGDRIIILSDGVKKDDGSDAVPPRDRYPGPISWNQKDELDDEFDDWADDSDAFGHTWHSTA